MSTTHTMQPQQHDVAAAPVADVKPVDGPVKGIYDKLFNISFGRWAVSAVAMGLAAGILSKKPGQKMLAAAAYTIAVGGLHVLLIFGPTIGPRARNSPMPPTWAYILLAMSTPLWLSALVVTFVFRESHDKYEIIDTRGLLVGLKDVASSSVAVLENISLACGCMGICAVIFNLGQCYYIFKLRNSNFSPEQLEEGYSQVNEPKTSTGDKEDSK